MKIKTIKSFRWMLDKEVYGFSEGKNYEIDDIEASQMISAGFAKKAGVLDIEKPEPLLSEEALALAAENRSNTPDSLENKMVDLNYKKQRGRPRLEEKKK